MLSFGTAGCNITCRFCQNWDISKSREMDKAVDEASPAAIASAAARHGSQSVAFTYNDQVIFAEYAMDTADACRRSGLKTVAVTAGYMHKGPAKEFFAKMDSAKRRPQGFHRRLLFQALRRPPAAVLAGDHHPADPRPQRL